MKLARVETVDTDIQRVESGIKPLLSPLLEAIAVGGHGNFLDARGGGNHLDDLGEIAAQGGLAPRDAHLAGAHGGKTADHAADLGNREKGLTPRFVTFGGTITVRQAIGATEIAHIGH